MQMFQICEYSLFGVDAVLHTVVNVNVLSVNFQ